MTKLLSAAKAGRFMEVSDLLDGRSRLDVVDNHGNTVLHFLAAHDRNYLIAKAIERGADVNAVNEDKETPLHIAAEKNNPDSGRALLEGGADVGKQAGMGRDPLLTHIVAWGKRGFRDTGHYARSLEFVKQLVDHGADLEQRNEGGISRVLCEAAASGWTDCAVYLFDQGVRYPAGPYGHHQSPLQLAAIANHPQTLSVLLERGGALDERDNVGAGLLHAACEASNKECIEWLIRKGADVNVKDDEGMTPLHKLLGNDRQGKRAENTGLLVEGGARIMERDKRGRTAVDLVLEGWGDWSSKKAVIEKFARSGQDKDWGALHRAVMEGNETEVMGLLEKTKDAVGLLSDAGASDESIVTIAESSGLLDIDRPAFGMTPLHLAIQLGRSDMAELLLAHGADPDRCVQAGKTALGYALRKGNIKIVRRLLSLGADMAGSHAAFSRWYSNRYLLEVSGDHNKVRQARKEMLVELLQAGMSVTGANAAGRTLLHEMCYADAGMEEIVIMVEYGAGDAVNSQDQDGNTPLMAYLQSGYVPYKNVLLLLLSQEAEVNIVNNKGKTALDILLEGRTQGKQELVDLLVAWGAGRQGGAPARGAVGNREDGGAVRPQGH